MSKDIFGHNHFTRDIRPYGECPSCDRHYDMDNYETDNFFDWLQNWCDDNGTEHYLSKKIAAGAAWEYQQKRIDRLEKELKDIKYLNDSLVEVIEALNELEN